MLTFLSRRAAFGCQRRLISVGRPGTLIVPNESDALKFSGTLTNLIRNNRISRAYKKIEEFRQTFQPSQAIYNNMLQVYAQNSDFKNALRVHQEMERGIGGCKPDSVTYNILIGLFGKLDQVEEAEKVIQTMKTRNIPITIQNYNSLLHAYIINGHFQRGEELFFQILEAKEPTPNIVTFAEMLNLYDLKVETEHVDKLIDPAVSADLLSRCNAIVHAARQRDVALDLKLYNRLLKIHAKHVIGKDTTDVLTIYKQIKESVKPDVRTYNILLEMYSHLNSDKGIESTMMAMKVNQVTPDIRSYQAIQKKHMMNGDMKGIQDTIHDLRQAGLVPDLKFYSQLLSYYITKNQVRLLNHELMHQTFRDPAEYPRHRSRGFTLQQAIKTLGNMKKVGQVSSYLHKSVLILSSKMSTFNQTYDLFKAMIQEQTRMDIEVFNTMFEVCAKEQKIKDTILIYDQLKHSQTAIPNEQTYESLIGLFAPIYELEMIGRFLTDMVVKYQIYPTKKIVEAIEEMSETGEGLGEETKLQVKELKLTLKKIMRKYKPKEEKPIVEGEEKKESFWAKQKKKKLLKKQKREQEPEQNNSNTHME